MFEEWWERWPATIITVDRSELRRLTHLAFEAGRQHGHNQAFDPAVQRILQAFTSAGGFLSLRDWDRLAGTLARELVTARKQMKKKPIGGKETT